MLDKTAPPIGPAYRLAIFDFDGTLADTFGWFVSVMDEVATRFSIDRSAAPPLDEMRAMSAGEIVRLLDVPTWKLPLIARHVRRRAAAESGGFRLFEGVAPMLARLEEAGVALVVVSSNAEETVRRALGPENAARFRHFACGASLFGKSRLFRQAMGRCGAEPARTICLGDEVRDGEAARAAGAAFGAVLWGFNSEAALARARPDIVFGRVEEIARRLAPRVDARPALP